MEILFEDDYLIAVNKPAGLPSVPGVGVIGKNTLMGKVREFFREKGIKPYLLHRLDQKTSGLVLFGKFPRDRQALEKIFQKDSTRKRYLAFVKGRPKKLQGIITFPLDARHTKKKVPAKTIYQCIHPYNDYTLVEAEISTGRRHQIRQHFAMIHHPLVNDFEYGDRSFNRTFQKKYKTHFFFLHAFSLRFEHPFTKKWVTIEAPIPKNFQAMI